MPLADDNFRSKFLWGRKPMLAACAARLAERSDLVWVDVGGGTGVSPFFCSTAEEQPFREFVRWTRDTLSALFSILLMKIGVEADPSDIRCEFAFLDCRRMWT